MFPNLWTFLENSMNIMLITSWFNDILIESLYVCMGFGLYINSRVETEGWDIELLFKENAKKAAVPKMPAKAPGAVLAALLAFTPLAAALLAGTVPAWADETAEPPAEAVSAELYTAEPADPRDAALLEEVFASPDFGTSKQSWRIRFKRDEAAAASRFRDLPQLQELSGLLLRAFTAAALVTALVFGLRFACKRRRVSVSGTRDGTLTVAAEAAEDPDGLLEKAAALHGEGKIREAWALCFLAFIAALTKRGAAFPDGATEYEALALVRRSGVDPGPFEHFIRRWIPFAYGGRTPEEGSFAASLEACRELSAQGGTG
jgi:hypothetical protein